jgi:hypothetical protein
MLNFIKNFFKPTAPINNEVAVKPTLFKNKEYLNTAEVPSSLLDSDYAVYNCGFMKERQAFILVPIIRNFDQATGEFISLTSKESC